MQPAPGGHVEAAVILAGGRSSRLGGVPKAALIADGDTLLGSTVAAARAAVGGGSVVVVGPPLELSGMLRGVPQVVIVGEDPPFSGPASGLAAGLDAIPAGAAVPSGQRAEGAPDSSAGGGLILVLACDMPLVRTAVTALLGWAAETRRDGDGCLAVDNGREQPLVALYRRSRLLRAVEKARGQGVLDNGSVFRLIASLDITRLNVPPGCTADVDTWADAQALGVTGSGQAERQS
ncbi:molybdenum cofactor guanylyltransferase [Paenarthrobacter sp. Z7-10]|uniref:molybdenum cofactor guanylyltransferase n=1 Tax=Paenarthrobacter sp. Z7-10 TaxID=2787635 RepID=UPI0022A9DE4E|nr:NTP transferase domain-containing protein [Paenarthrobacter sp. Z7-10]